MIFEIFLTASCGQVVLFHWKIADRSHSVQYENRGNSSCQDDFMNSLEDLIMNHC